MAALVASRSGASVVVLEKTDSPGGGTALGHKGVRAAGSRYQRDRGISDSAEQYEREIMQRNRNQSDIAITKRLTQVSGRMIDFLAESAGVEFYLDDFSFGQRAPRSHTWESPKAITDFLFDALAADPQVEMRFSTSVLSLRQDPSGVITGVSTADGDVAGQKVILATGGFGASSTLLSRYIPKAVGVAFPGHNGSTGDGIEMGLSVGGVVENMDSFQPYPAHIGPGKRGLPPGVILSGGIVVDRHGQRFVDESNYPGGIALAILDLPDKTAYEIFDRRIYEMHRKGTGERGLQQMFESGLFTEADTAETLASGLGIDPAGLSATIDECNDRAGGTGDRFGRSRELPLEPPFFGIKVQVALYHTQGGLRVSPDAQVLREDGSVIPNLYAGGGAAVGLSGKGLDGYFPGNGLLASLGLGMIAAEHAVRSLSEPRP